MATSFRQLLARQDNFSESGELRLVFQLFREAQESRIAHGERLRALFQGRTTLSAAAANRDDIESLLARICFGETVGAPRSLERAYARAVSDEAEAAAELRVAVQGHAIWPWLQGIKGVGHLLAARLLSRLDVERAKTPSAFWAYCGLGTIPGVAFHCRECGLEVAYPLGYKIQNVHLRRSGLGECTGQLEEAIKDAQVRVAPRRSVLGGRSGYDAEARKACYLLGVSMLRCRSDYKSFYDSERAKLADGKPGWTAKHCHLAAIRKMEKTFLRDLWLAWRRALNLPTVAPYFPRSHA